jgi:hypothetical protein
MKRAIVVIGAVLLATFGVALRSEAQTAVCSRTTLAPGQHIGVSGDGFDAGTTITLLFNGSTIAAGTVNGFGDFALSGTIPGSTPPGLYTVSVSGTAGGVPDTVNACTVSVEDRAPTPAPTTVPSNATSTATQAPQFTFIPVPVVVQQQQQQQQQQLPAPAPEPRVVPASFSRSSALPTTGSNTGELAQGGMGALIIGISLVEFARRRKRRFATAASAPASGFSEGDLFLPFWPR